jgi:TonB family protein
MSLITYFLQANLYLVLFYAFYRLLLNKETYFMMNRFYLTGTVLLSFMIPGLRLQWLSEETVSRNLYINMPDIVPHTEISQSNDLNWWQLLSVIYITGIVFSLLRLVFKLMIVRKSIENPDKGAAFSFLGYKTIDKTLEDYNTINVHEEAHIRQLHSLDVLFLEIVSIVTWFNPVIYLYKTSIRNIHEFLADQAASDYMGDKKEYAFLLLSKALNVNQYPLTNSFFKQSLVKQRVFMLQKQRSGLSAIAKYSLIIPLLAIMIILSSATIFSNNEKTPNAISIVRQPEFPGGFNKFAEYLIRTVKYPAQAIKAGAEGRVFLSFVVKPDGSLTDIKIVKSVESSLDNEAIRVIQNSPKWTPGTINGKPARVQFKMPLNFQLPVNK